MSEWDGKERRSCLLTDSDLEKIAAQISTEMQSRFTVPSEQHKQHHEFICSQIEHQKARAELYFRITEHVIKLGIVGFLGAIGIVLWEGFIKRVNT